jgi:hypothetical protein
MRAILDRLAPSRPDRSSHLPLSAERAIVLEGDQAVLDQSHSSSAHFYAILDAAVQSNARHHAESLLAWAQQVNFGHIQNL